eukprot:1138051-Pelagomonas_calceolata.AAC.2
MVPAVDEDSRTAAAASSVRLGPSPQPDEAMENKSGCKTGHKELSQSVPQLGSTNMFFWHEKAGYALLGFSLVS